MVLFPGHDEYSESAEREGCAEIRDVVVVEEARRRGVGTALIRELERSVLMHGMTMVGMSVAIGPDAGPGELLYAKLGYAVAHGPFITSTDLDADDGRLIPVGAVMCYLTKTLY
jgi:GNAT superfamily N-acetyltransferase